MKQGQEELRKEMRDGFEKVNKKIRMNKNGYALCLLDRGISSKTSFYYAKKMVMTRLLNHIAYQQACNITLSVSSKMLSITSITLVKIITQLQVRSCLGFSNTKISNMTVTYSNIAVNKETIVRNPSFIVPPFTN